MNSYAEMCNGNDLRRVFASATSLLERNAEFINALNVFPVPDGDTGTNMLLTMRAVIKETSRVNSSSATEVATALASAALRGARGNSGVILSQFFKGLAQGLEAKEEFGGHDFAQALEKATECAYKAVSKPTEGTILTVIREAAQGAQKRALEDGRLTKVWQAACDAARDALARTPSMLPVLQEAGVVDAGGQGLVVILEGALRSFLGENVETIAIDLTEAIGVKGPKELGSVSEAFLTATQEELYGYCTQLLIQGKGLQVDALRERFASISDSTVVVGDDTLIQVHTHTFDPGTIISYAVSQGTISQVKIDNIDEQHQEFLAARRKELETLPVCVVAVVSGDGFATLFRNLGAWGVIPGGDTMNPSTQEILKVIEQAPSDSVIVLPNNSNIIPAATQACELSKKPLKVVPTTSIPQGIAALLSFSPEVSLEANLIIMERSSNTVCSGGITRAVRSATINRVSVREGQLIGLLERQMVAAGDDPTSVLMDVLQRAEVSAGHLITLYWGCDITKEEAEKAGEGVQVAFPGVEVEVVYGGQPYYHYITSIE